MHGTILVIFILSLYAAVPTLVNFIQSVNAQPPRTGQFYYCPPELIGRVPQCPLPTTPNPGDICDLICQYCKEHPTDIRCIRIQPQLEYCILHPDLCFPISPVPGQPTCLSCPPLDLSKLKPNESIIVTQLPGGSVLLSKIINQNITQRYGIDNRTITTPMSNNTG
jgi:hypothetical protein